MKKSLKRFTALVLMLAVVLTAALPVFAEDNLFYSAGTKIVLVGKGAENHSVVMDLDGGTEVKTVFYPVTSVKLTQPEYKVEVADVPDNEDLKVKVVYNEALDAYGIEITAKAMMRANFEIKYFKKTERYFEMFAFTNIDLLVINREDHLFDPEEQERKEKDEDDTSLYDGYRTQSGKINVAEGLEYCAKYQTLPVDISHNNKISTSWLTALKGYPNKSLAFTGKTYAWTIRGSDVTSSKKIPTAHTVKISRKKEDVEEIETALGINNAPIFVVDGMSQFPVTRAELSLQVSGKDYKNATVNVYRYKNGKIYVVDQNLSTDKDGWVSFSTYAENGTYIVCKNKSPNAIL